MFVIYNPSDDTVGMLNKLQAYMLGIGMPESVVEQFLGHPVQVELELVAEAFTDAGLVKGNQHLATFPGLLAKVLECSYQSEIQQSTWH